MKTAVLCLTAGGYQVAVKVKEVLKKNGHQATLFAPAGEFARAGEAVFFYSLAETVQDVFAGYRRIVFVMAMGIVVRMIAPHIRDKTVDPGVVVMDEAGEYVISVLSGHLGGANELARRIAALTGARPVITTATDVLGLPALDELARIHDLAMDPPGAALVINSALVNGRTVCFYAPEYMHPADCKPGARFHRIENFNSRPEKAEYSVVVTNRLLDRQGDSTVFLRPKNLVAGVGCRSGTPEQIITAALLDALERCRRSPLSLRALATIGIKAREPGLQGAAKKLDLPLIVFSRVEINEYMRGPGQNLSRSDFVLQKVGVPAVCEPAALLASRKGELILPKHKFPGVAIAVAEDGWR